MPTRPIPPYTDHIIEGVMPSLELHLVAGPPGIGKTGLMLQILPEIERGERIFGYPSHPTKSVFISCDRGERAHMRRLDHAGIPHYSFQDSTNASGAFPYFSGLHTNDGENFTLHNIVKQCSKLYPDRPLLFIDGMGALVGESKDYHDIQQFLRLGTRLCLEYACTIIGSVHSPKAKEGQTYTNPREQILGSQAWAGFSDLVITVQPDDPKKPSGVLKVSVCTRSSAGDFDLLLTRDSTGRYIEYKDSNEQDLLTVLIGWMNKQDFDRLIPKREITQYGMRDCQLSERTIERWLTDQVESGTLTRPQKGKYQRVRSM